MRLFNGLFTATAAAAIGMAVVPAVAMLAAVHLEFAGAHEPTVVQQAVQRDLTLWVCGTMLLAAAAGVGASWLFARRWSTPHLALLDASDQVAQGHLDGSFAGAGSEETRTTMRNIARIARSFDRLETARRTWLVAVCEELRFPVDGLQRQVGGMREQGSLPQATIDELSDGVQRLSEMAEDLHAVALADLGRLPVTFAPTDPRALIHNAIWVNARRAAASGVTLDTSALPSSTVVVRWDAGRIEQLFTALIESSLRYVPHGGRVALGMTPSRGAWQLVVDDSAPGVDVMLAQRLFEPFYRTMAEPGMSVTQSGLGLATAHAIVEAHHGRIEASRSPLGGLRITVVLPEKPPIA